MERTILIGKWVRAEWKVAIQVEWSFDKGQEVYCYVWHDKVLRIFVVPPERVQSIFWRLEKSRNIPPYNNRLLSGLFEGFGFLFDALEGLEV